MPLPGSLSAHPLQGREGALRARPCQTEAWEEEGSSCSGALGPGLLPAHRQGREGPGLPWGSLILSTCSLNVD